MARRGELLVERYFNGTSARRAANIKSASKSVLSALVGIALGQGHLDSVDQTIAEFFPAYLATAEDPRKREITIEDLLTMRAGLESTSFRNYGAWVTSRNWVRHALTRPMRSDPGTARGYSTGNTHLLSAILTQATGLSTWEYAQRHLAQPIGFSLARWPTDPQGIYFGGNDMLFTPRQMLQLGSLYLNRGRIGDQQVIPAQWVDRSVITRTRSRRGGTWLQLRLVGPIHGQAEDLLRVGLRRPVHLRRARPRPGRRHHLVDRPAGPQLGPQSADLTRSSRTI